MNTDVRIVALAGATGKSRLMKHDGREHLVVPVVALVEGVIHPVNAPTRELVKADLFSRTLSSWNGRPLFAGHPLKNGSPVSGNTPDVLETCLGRVFNPRVDGKRLLMEAWLDPDRCAANPEGRRLLERAKANDLIEVSVGVFVDAVPTMGEWNGRGYSAEWASMTPDHLALLAEGQVGACSAAMGCGIRAAQGAEDFDDDFRIAWPDKTGKDSHGRDGSEGHSHAGDALNESKSAGEHVRKFSDSSKAQEHFDAVRGELKSRGYKEMSKDKGPRWETEHHVHPTEGHVHITKSMLGADKDAGRDADEHHVKVQRGEHAGFAEMHHEAPGGWKAKITRIPNSGGKVYMEVHNPKGAHIGGRKYADHLKAKDHLNRMSESHTEVGKFVGHPSWKGASHKLLQAADEDFRAAWPDKSGKDDHGRPEGGGVHSYTHPVHGKTEVDYGKPGEMSAHDVLETHLSLKKQGYTLDKAPELSAKTTINDMMKKFPGFSKKAVNDVGKASAHPEGGKITRKFKQDDREAARNHYESLKIELKSQGFAKQSADKGSGWEGEHWHHPTKGHVSVEKAFIGVIPGDYAKGHRGFHEVKIRGGRYLAAAEEWTEEMRAAEEVTEENPGLMSRILSALFGSIAESDEDVDNDDFEEFRAAWPDKSGQDDHGRDGSGGNDDVDPEAFKPGEKPNVGDRVTFTKSAGGLFHPKRDTHGVVKRVSTNKNTIGHHIIVVRPDHPGHGMAPDDERVSAHWLKRFKLKVASASEEEEEFRAAWPDKSGKDDHGRGLDSAHIGEGHVETSEQYHAGAAAHVLGIRVPGHTTVHSYRRAGNDWEHEKLGPVKDKNLKWMLNRASEMVVKDDRTDRKLKTLVKSEELELRAACGCGGTCDECTHDHAAIAAEGEKDMERKQRIAALAANPHSTVKSLKALEVLTDEELEQAEKAAAAAKASADKATEDGDALKTAQASIKALETAAETLKTEDGFLAAAPQSIRDIVAGNKATLAAKTDALIGQLKTAQSAFTEEELKAKPIGELEKLAALAKVEAPADYSGRGIPRYAQESPASFAPPDPYAEDLKALQAAK